MKQAASPVKKRLSSTGLIFVSAYLCQGIAQHFCLVSQPLNNFLKNGPPHMSAVQVSVLVASLMMPWVIKPIYGLLADFAGFARSGPRRLRFLQTIHCLAGLAYLTLVATLYAAGRRSDLAYLAVPATTLLVGAAGVCIAFATVIWVAMTVELSYEDDRSRLYFGQQAVAYSSANIVSLYVGGLLCNVMPASDAFCLALGLAALPLFTLPIFLQKVMGGAPEKTVGDEAGGERSSLATRGREVWLAIKHLAGERPYLVTLAFLAFWNLSPSLGVSLYYYESDKLRFNQAWIGTLGACTGAGTLLGSFIFRYWLADFFLKPRSTYVLVVMGTLSALSYFFLHSPASGVPIEVFRGCATIITTLAVYGLAADVSPREITATAMAIQIAVLNLASEGSIALGGFLYEQVFHKELLPLILVSALTTLLTAFLVPFLGKPGLKKAGF